VNFSDPIADLLTRLRNAQKAGHAAVSIPASKVKILIVRILHNEGFIEGYRCIRDHSQGVIKVILKYDGRGIGVIRGCIRQSSPSLRKYLKKSELGLVKSGYGIGIFSTSRGIMTNRRAFKMNVGGEYLCSVW